MARAIGRRGRAEINVWPGWVDGLSSLIMVVVFVLLVFVVSQFALQSALIDRNDALVRLENQVEELDELLGLEKAATAELESSQRQLSLQLQQANAEGDTLRQRLAAVADRSTLLERQLTESRAAADASAAEAERLARAVDEADRTIQADRETIEVQLATIQSLSADIDTLRSTRERLETELAALGLLRDEAEARAADLEAQRADLEDQRASLEDEREALTRNLELSADELETLRATLMAERDRALKLEADLSTSEERTALVQSEVTERDLEIAALKAAALATEADLADREGEIDEQALQMQRLNAQIDALRVELNRVVEALGVAEARASEQDLEISELQGELNAALASRVQELARYRSEFFGRLRQVLGDRQDIRIVGDRFVFQSEVLFDSGSAQLEFGQGRGELASVAEALREISAEIPEGIDWVLRVDGHTDKRPIATAEFPSNWELSTARAISVVRFLKDAGIPADRLAAAGFGEFQPLDPGDDEIAFRRNRRIELKLDQR